MDEKKYKKLDLKMKQMPEDWRKYWCSVSNEWPCMCMGCANEAGGLVKDGFTKQDWEEWIKNNSEMVT